MKILSELCKNANISVPRLSKLLSTNSSVLYSRIKRLYKRNLIQKSTIVVNEPLLGINVKAVVGINRDPKLKEEIHTALLKIFQTNIILNLLFLMSLKGLARNGWKWYAQFMTEPKYRFF